MHACATGAIEALDWKHDTGRWLRLQGGTVLDGNLLPGIIALAERIEPDREAVAEWFREAPIHPHGKTAMQLVQAGQEGVVIAFLQWILADSGSAPDISENHLPWAPSTDGARRVGLTQSRLRQAGPVGQLDARSRPTSESACDLVQHARVPPPLQGRSGFSRDALGSASGNPEGHRG